jgi:hypothetical protein
MDCTEASESAVIIAPETPQTPVECETEAIEGVAARDQVPAVSLTT